MKYCFLFLICILSIAEQAKGQQMEVIEGDAIKNAYESRSYFVGPDGSVTLTPGFTFTATAGSDFFVATDPSNRTITTATSEDMNYVLSETILKLGVTTDAGVNGLSVEDKTSVFNYVDGLGRPVQQVIMKGSPKTFDLVQPIAYDVFGREAIAYLPYMQVANDGLYKSDALDQNVYTNSRQYQYYQRAGAVARDIAPKAETVFEASPFNRISEQGAAGVDWQLGTGHTIKFRYLVNQASEVRLWYLHTSGLPRSDTYYGAGELIVNVTEDEHGNEVKEYTDKLGRTILKSVQNGGEFLKTHYIYDYFDNLRYVLPPEATARLDYTPDANFLNTWSFQYKYDGRRRMVEKTVPGTKTVYMIYDDRDRIILTQDGKQRANSGTAWTYTKYDALNRPVITGTYTHGSTVGRTTMQGLVPTMPGSESYTGNTGNHGYTNTAFPTTGLEVLTVTYYDNDDFKTHLLWGTNYNFDLPAEISGTSFSKLTGQVTGGKVRILGTNDFINTINYYDDRYRIIQTISGNHLGGYDKTSSEYDFANRLTKIVQEHSSTTENAKVLREFAYDHASRLLTIHQTIDTAPPILLAANEYNEIGELVEKNLHQNAGTLTFLQSVDYRYNIRGWLSHINNSTLTNDGTNNDDSNDLFGMELIYNQALININGTNTERQYNGNISAIKWKTDIQSGVPTERIYGYTYDPVNRLTKARYAAKSGANWTGEAGFHDVENLTYDKNGNILSLRRYANLGGSRDDIDNLTYNYGQTNQLKSVQDNGGTSEGFLDGVNLTTEYAYDDNGNLTYDLNKDITAIRYNYLNLPREVEFQSGQKIVFTYDATGTKLKKEVLNGDGSTTSKVDYLNGFQYEDGKLLFFATDEGRAIKNGNDYEYEYFLTDHLGNIRLTFGWLKDKDVFKATMETENNTEESVNFIKLSTSATSLANNHTASYEVEGIANEAARLNGYDNTAVGPGIVLADVAAGDKVSAEVFARYSQSTSTNATVAGTMFSLVASAFGIVNGGETAALYSHFDNNWAATLGTITSSGGTEPKAYLNYIIFRDDLSGVPQFGFIPVTTAATSDFEKLSFEIDIPYSGDMYIYVANESNEQDLFVWFDDMKVVHQKNSWGMEVTGADDYYPFGLQIAQNVYQRESATKQRYKYNGKELQPELGLNWHNYGARMYQADLGRWTLVDPMSDKMQMVSPYAYSFNNPILYQDKDGAIPIIPLLIKAGANGAADMMLQVAMNYYFDDKVTSLQEAFDQVNWWQVGRSSAEGLIPWKTPGGRLGRAAGTAVGDVLINAIDQGSSYSQEQALQDFAAGFIGDLVGGGIGELVGKYGVRGVAAGLRKIGLDGNYVKKLTGISGNFTGGLVKNNKADAAADALAEKLGGQSRVSFANDPLSREFDAVSDAFIGQTKSISQLGTAFRKQAKGTFEAAKETGKGVYYEFTGGAPSKNVIDKLEEYAKRYGVKLTIEIVN